MAASRYRDSLSYMLLIASNLLIPVSIIIFAIGFFPYKPYLPGFAEYEALDFGPPPAAPFDKLIFMVVDALRSDFVFSDESGFTFTQSLIRDGAAIPFTANARSPTVTMPRIKAITTGSIPSFVDLILNFDEADTSSTLAAQDTWLGQFKAKDAGKLLMFGDDTWLKLFPNTFDREDGTSSFFVSDFSEVDYNVTRNIAGELANDDWGLMVLHYLGLDHIGHKAGPRSVHMRPKQEEMDGIVKIIYHAIESNDHLKSTLLVVCGDHGMNDAGNHGASSPGETSTALLFLSPKIKEVSPGRPAPEQPSNEFDYYSLVEQSDLAPTLAALLGFPVPKNNLGAFIPDLLPFFSKASDKVQILLRNARQILGIVTASFGTDLFDLQGRVDPCAEAEMEINQLACIWRKINRMAVMQAQSEEIDQDWLSQTSRWLRRAQDLMSSMASNYDMSKLISGLGLAVTGMLVSFAVALHQAASWDTVPLVAVSLLYATMMFASSYVEEEQHFWYWMSTMWLAYLGVREARRTRKVTSLYWPILSLSAMRLIRSWNQTGQKFAGQPDLVKMFAFEYPTLLWILVSAAYGLTAFQILPALEGLPYIAATGLATTLVSMALSFKLAFTAEDAPELVVGLVQALHDMFQGQTLLFRARVVFALITFSSVFAAYHALTGGPRAARTSAQLLHHLYTILAMTQSRTTNIPLLLLFTLLLQQLQSLPLSIAEITTTSMLLQYASFFAFGGSNAISSVDLSSAYNGISDFNVVAVGLLIFISNWAGPIFWTSATNLLLLQKAREGKTGVWRIHIGLSTAFVTASIAGVMAACTALRAHLFIWTVFSPKYLYSLAWGLGQHLLINVGLGGVLFWLGTR